MRFGSFLRKVPPRLYLIVFYWRRFSTPHGSSLPCHPEVRRIQWFQKPGFSPTRGVLAILRQNDGNISSMSFAGVDRSSALCIGYYRNHERSQTKLLYSERKWIREILFYFKYLCCKWTQWICKCLHLYFWISYCIKVLTHIECSTDKIRGIIPKVICKVHICCSICLTVLWSIPISICSTVILPIFCHCVDFWKVRHSEFLSYSSRSYRYSKKSLKSRFCKIWIFFIFCRSHQSCRHEEKVFFFIPDECTRIREDIRTRSDITECECCFLFWIFHITHIIEIDLYASIPYSTMSTISSIISDTDEAVFIIWVKVCRIPWYFQFAKRLYVFGIRKIDHKEWINLLECNEIESISYKARWLKVFSRSNSWESTENISSRRKNGNSGTLLFSMLCCHNAKILICIFIHRILTEWISWNEFWVYIVRIYPFKWKSMYECSACSRIPNNWPSTFCIWRTWRR